MSALGQKQTFAVQVEMSAMAMLQDNYRVSKSSCLCWRRSCKPLNLSSYGFSWALSGMRICPLCAKSGHYTLGLK